MFEHADVWALATLACSNIAIAIGIIAMAIAMPMFEHADVIPRNVGPRNKRGCFKHPPSNTLQNLWNTRVQIQKAMVNN